MARDSTKDFKNEVNKMNDPVKQVEDAMNDHYMDMANEFLKDESTKRDTTSVDHELYTVDRCSMQADASDVSGEDKEVGGAPIGCNIETESDFICRRFHEEQICDVFCGQRLCIKSRKITKGS